MALPIVMIDATRCCSARSFLLQPTKLHTTHSLALRYVSSTHTQLSSFHISSASCLAQEGTRTQHKKLLKRRACRAKRVISGHESTALFSLCYCYVNTYHVPPVTKSKHLAWHNPVCIANACREQAHPRLLLFFFLTCSA